MDVSRSRLRFDAERTAWPNDTANCLRSTSGRSRFACEHPGKADRIGGGTGQGCELTLLLFSWALDYMYRLGLSGHGFATQAASFRVAA
ncbi:hypothetical protein P3T23_008004 [Paraburkholderia sp. GAS448]